MSRTKKPRQPKRDPNEFRDRDRPGPWKDVAHPAPVRVARGIVRAMEIEFGNAIPTFPQIAAFVVGLMEDRLVGLLSRPERRVYVARNLAELHAAREYKRGCYDTEERLAEEVASRHRAADARARALEAATEAESIARDHALAELLAIALDEKPATKP